jgi:hypothetical protein
MSEPFAESDVPLGDWFRRTPESLRMLDEETEALRSAEEAALLAESPMFRYECCEHCRTSRCPRHDGHPDPCSADPLVSGTCQAGSTMIGEPTRVLPPADGRPTPPTGDEGDVGDE